MSGDAEGEDAFSPKDALLCSPDVGPFVEEDKGGSSALSWTWGQSTTFSQWSPEPESSRSPPFGMDCQEDSDLTQKAPQQSQSVGAGTGSGDQVLGPDRQVQEGQASPLFQDLQIQPTLAPMKRKAQFLEKLHVALHDILAENWGKKLSHVAQGIGSTGKGGRPEEAESHPDLQEIPGDGLPGEKSPPEPDPTPPEVRWLTPVAFPDCLAEVCEQGIFSRLALAEEASVDCPLDTCEVAREGEKVKRHQPDASPPSPTLTLERANKKSRLLTNFREVRKRRKLREEVFRRRDERGRYYRGPAQSATRADPKTPENSFLNSPRETCRETRRVAGTSFTAERECKVTGKTQKWTGRKRALSAHPASFAPHGSADPLLPKGTGSGESSVHPTTRYQRMTATSAVEVLRPLGRSVSKTSRCSLDAPLDSSTLASFSRLSREVATEDLDFALVPKAVTGDDDDDDDDDDSYLSNIAEELESAVDKGVASGANRRAMSESSARLQGFSTTNQPHGQAAPAFPGSKPSSKRPGTSRTSLDSEVTESSRRPSKHQRNRSRAGEKPRRQVLSTPREWGRNRGSRLEKVEVSRNKEEEERTLPRLPNGVKLVCYLGSGSSVRLLGAVSQAWEPKQPPQLEELEDLSETSSEAPSQASQISSCWSKNRQQERGATKDTSNEGEKKPLSQLGRTSGPLPAEKSLNPAEPKVREQKRRPPKEKPLSVPGPSLQLSGAQVRSAVAESLREVLLKRLQEPTNLTVDEEAVRGIAANIEAAIFELMQCTDYRYKTKYRSLVFNLRDPKNKDLFLQVIRGDITPQGLVRMSATELASQELAEWRDREVKHGLEIIEKQQREAPSCRVTKLTHKGEIEIHPDVDQTLTLEDLTEPASCLDLSLRPQPGPAESHSGRDTTEQHESHFLDPDCRVCMGWEAPRGGRGFNAPRSIPPSRSKVISTPQRPPGPVSLPRVDTPLPRMSRSRIGPRTQPHNRSEVVAFPRQFLKPKTLLDQPLWEGSLEVFSIKRFAVKAFLIHGYNSHLIQALPKVIYSAGCVLPETVWDYWESIRSSDIKCISVVRLCPRGTRDGQNYSMLYSYLNNKQRYGMAASEHLDMFLMPLPAFQPVPPKIRPLGGPGLEVTHCSLVLGLILPKASPGDSRLNGVNPMQEKKRKTVTFKETVETKCYSPGFRKPEQLNKPGPSWAPGAKLEGPPSREGVSTDLLPKATGCVEQKQRDGGATGSVEMEHPSSEVENQACLSPSLFLTPFCGSDQPPSGY